MRFLARLSKKLYALAHVAPPELARELRILARDCKQRDDYDGESMRIINEAAAEIKRGNL